MGGWGRARVRQALPRWATRDFLAATIHIASGIALLAVAATEGPCAGKGASCLDTYRHRFWYRSSRPFYFTPRKWYYTCSAGGWEYCSEDERTFLVDPPANAVFVNAIALAASYTFVSGVHHLIVWSGIVTSARSAIDLRWLDYAISAPSMLAVIGLVFGSDSAGAIVWAPVLLAWLLIVGWAAERNLDGDPVLPWAKAVVVVVLLLYVVAITPSLYAAYMISYDVDSSPTIIDNVPVGVGQAPAFVFVFAVVTMLFFSSFGVLYTVDMFVHPVKHREAFYTTLSLISKTTLHLFIGISVIQQGQLEVGAADAGSARPTEMDSLRDGLVGSAVLVVCLSGASWLLPSTQFNMPSRDQYNIPLMDDRAFM